MLSILFSFKYLIVYLFIGCGTYIHFRGKKRHKLRRQILDHSTFFAPYNVAMYALSSISNRPVCDPKEFPSLNVLTDQWQTIRDEAERLYFEGHIKIAEARNDIAFNSFFRTGWKRFYIKWYDDVMPSAAKLCPKSVEIVRNVPQINAAMFAMLPPGGRLGEHRDPFAGSLRYHLGLSTPNSEDCYIMVDGYKLWWEDGKPLLFDETYIHSAYNGTDQPRIILFCDVTRPLKYRWSRKINQFVIDHLIKASTSQNVPSERVGCLNHIASGVHRFSQTMQKIKAWNRKFYYFTKYCLITLLVYLIFLKDFLNG